MKNSVPDDSRDSHAGVPSAHRCSTKLIGAISWVDALQQTAAAPETAPETPAEVCDFVEERDATFDTDLSGVHGVRTLLAHEVSRCIERAAQATMRLQAKAEIWVVFFSVRPRLEREWLARTECGATVWPVVESVNQFEGTCVKQLKYTRNARLAKGNTPGSMCIVTCRCQGGAFAG